MIKLLEARYVGQYRIELVFSDGQHGIFDMNAYLATRQGPLLEPLYDETYLQRFFILNFGHSLKISDLQNPSTNW